MKLSLTISLFWRHWARKGYYYDIWYLLVLFITTDPWCDCEAYTTIL